MIDENIPITFGVELELVFAFHEDLLRAYLNSINDNSLVVKDFSEEDRVAMRKQLNVGYTDRQRYMGWGLTGQTQHPLVGWNSRHLLRTYGDGPMQIAREILPSMLYNIDVHFDQAKQTNFSRWHLTYDSSVLGVDKATLLAKLGARIESVKDWDSHGMELVSRVLGTDSESFNEISGLLTALIGTNDKSHGALVTEHCGMHIHVGLPSIPGTTNFENPRFELSTLQHLAYILVMYESHISTLHPLHRREGSPASTIDIQSNTFDFRLAQPQPTSRQIYNPRSNSPETVHSVRTLIPLDQVRAKIWRNGMTPNALANMMGRGKGFIVNWSYLHRLPGEGPRTLEFRQHEGTLDTEEVRWWALFVMGLVSIAQHIGRLSPDGAGDGYRYEEWDEGMNVGDVFDLMRFPPEGREYFERRAAFIATGVMQGVEVSGPLEVPSGLVEEVGRDQMEDGVASDFMDVESLSSRSSSMAGITITEGDQGITVPVSSLPQFTLESRGPSPPRRNYSPPDLD